MKEKIIFVATALAIATLLAFATKKVNQPTFSVAKYKQKNLIRCSPDWDELKEWLEETSIPPIPGAGSYKWTISTKNDSAQFYFNQGINMYYSFHIIEAMASFKKAAKLDPTAGMLEWAQALAYGPNINDVGYAASPEALAASAKALDLSAGCTQKEIMLIRAQQVRYSADSTDTRAELNQLYVDAMKLIYEAYSDDADVAALYADALMLQHPWDLWNKNGTPKPWTPLIREVLEKLLAKTPGHPGANHYYIHVMEPSPYAALALPSADRLGKLTPGLSHTVHMPSHIYLRTGDYGKGSSVNEDAVKSYKKSIKLYEPVTGADFLYEIHNLHMQTNNAMLAGRMDYSVKSANQTIGSIKNEYLSIPGAMGNYVQYIYMTPVLVNVRFGRWDQLLNLPKPDREQSYANVLRHFGMGMALAHKGDIGGAEIELRQLQQFLHDSSLYLPLSPFAAAIEGSFIAENMLAGSIALIKKDHAFAIAAFKKAVSLEDSMTYNEPRDWLLNPKHYLGNALLKAAKWEEAEKVFLLDLNNNSENGWALYGLYQSLKLQDRKAEADKALSRYKKAFGKADIKLTDAVF